MTLRPPCAKGAVGEADWGIVEKGKKESNPDNPSVTASPCHLPLHRRGERAVPFDLYAQTVKSTGGGRLASAGASGKIAVLRVNG